MEYLNLDNDIVVSFLMNRCGISTIILEKLKHFLKIWEIRFNLFDRELVVTYDKVPVME